MSCASFLIFDNGGSIEYNWVEDGTYSEELAPGILFVFEEGLIRTGEDRKRYKFVAGSESDRFLGISFSSGAHLAEYGPGTQYYGEDDKTYRIYLVHAAHTHTFSTDWTADSLHHWHAATCGHDVVSDRAAHDWDSGVVVRPASPSSPGEILYTCEVCGATKTEELAPLESVGTATASRVVETGKPEVHVTKEDETSRRRMQHTTFQSRLSAKMDGLSRKFMDNAIRLSSSAVDMVRVKAVRDQRSHDIISREMVANEILPIMLPPLKNVPLRYFNKSNSDIKIPSLYTMEQQEYIEIFCPMECNLDEDDLLIRFLEDPACPGDFYTMILQVKEVLANFSTTGLRHKKYYATFFEETLPEGIVEQLREEHRKHLQLGW